MGKKSTNFEQERRVYTVYKLLCRGASRSEIHRHGRIEWEITGWAVDKYISKARDMLKHDLQIERQDFAAEIIANYREIRSLAIKEKQYAVALGATSRMAALAQLEGAKT